MNNAACILDTTHSGAQGVEGEIVLSGNSDKPKKIRQSYPCSMTNQQASLNQYFFPSAVLEREYEIHRSRSTWAVLSTDEVDEDYEYMTIAHQV